MAITSNSSKIYFKEEQRLSNSPMIWIVYLAFIVDVVVSAWGLHQQVVLGKPFGNHPTSNTHLELFFSLSFVVMAFIVIIMMRMSLTTIIDETGIRFRFTLIMRQKFIPKAEISRYKVRKYKPLLEYGGWGYRRKSIAALVRQKVGVAYNVKGNMGLQLYLTHGSRILIGTQKPTGVERAMKKLMNEGGIVDG